MTHIKHDEIDLIETLHILKAGIRTISIFTIGGLLFSILFIAFDKPKYQSQVDYTVIAPPPFKSNFQVLLDFELLFYSKEIFEKWKVNYGTSNLVFDIISTTTVVEDYELTKNVKERLVISSRRDDSNSTLVIKSHHLPLLSDIFEYATFVQKELSNRYYGMAKEEVNVIKTQYYGVLNNNNEAFLRVLDLQRYLSTKESESITLLIPPPSEPQLTSFNRYVTLIISAVLGAISGVVFVLISHFSKIRKVH